MPEIETAPTPLQRVRELLIAKFGSLRCRHRSWSVVIAKDRLYLRCNCCGAETEGFKVAGREETWES